MRESTDQTMSGQITLEGLERSPADASLSNTLIIRPREDREGQVLTGTLVCRYLEMSGSWAGDEVY